MASEYLSLSLFIMLLSFFIILNSLSDFEETKAAPVLSSLDMAFSSSAIDRKETASSPKKITEKKSKGEGDTLDQIEGLFNAQIQAMEITKNRLGTEMHVKLTVEEFEKALGQSDQNLFAETQGQMGFLDTLVSLIQTAETKVPYRMDMILNIGANPSTLQNEKPQELRVSLKKVAGYSRFLQESGMPIKFLSAGLGSKDIDTIELTFRRYVPIRLGVMDVE